MPGSARSSWRGFTAGESWFANPRCASPFLHPHTHVKPPKHTTKMFAVAAQTTVRATAQVKATKVAAKEQKSA